jgi:hypothetical protein
LIVEGFLLGAGIFFELSPVMRIIALGVGVSLFLVVFVIVCWLVVRHPTNLVFSEESHIECDAMRIYDNSSKPRESTMIETIVAVQASSAECRSYVHQGGSL